MNHQIQIAQNFQKIIIELNQCIKNFGKFAKRNPKFQKADFGMFIASLFLKTNDTIDIEIFSCDSKSKQKYFASFEFLIKEKVPVPHVLFNALFLNNKSEYYTFASMDKDLFSSLNLKDHCIELTEIKRYFESDFDRKQLDKETKLFFERLNEKEPKEKDFQHFENKIILRIFYPEKYVEFNVNSKREKENNNNDNNNKNDPIQSSFEEYFLLDIFSFWKILSTNWENNYKIHYNNIWFDFDNIKIEEEISCNDQYSSITEIIDIKENIEQEIPEKKLTLFSNETFYFDEKKENFLQFKKQKK